MITTQECPDLPPCRHCGGHQRWLNKGEAPLAHWRWHCATCSPPPGEGQAAAPSEAGEV